MVSILILYFSGTGNTHYIANYIKVHLQLNEEEVHLESIETFNPEKIQEYNLICFGFPVYACNAPLHVRNYIKKIPKVNDKGIYLFCTKGLSAGNAIFRTYRRLKKKKFTYLGHSSIIMPGSDGMMMLSKGSKYAKKLSERDFDHIKKADKFVNLIKKCFIGIQSGERIDRFKKRSPLDLVVGILDLIMILLYKIFVKSFKGKFWVDENCTQCNTCVKICPVQNISLGSNGIEFSDKCFLCMRCINQCPQEAIQFGKRTVGKYRWKGPKKDFKPFKILADKNN